MGDNIEMKIKRDAYLHNLRGNSILRWTEDLKKVNRYREILKECSPFSTLEVENGIVRIYPSGRSLSHEFVPHVNAKLSFFEITVIMKHKILTIEDRYGRTNLSDEDIDSLQRIVFRYNRDKSSELDMADKGKLKHLEDTSMVLYYTLIRGVKLESTGGGGCTIMFGDLTTKEYQTILDENQIELLQEVNISINQEEVR